MPALTAARGRAYDSGMNTSRAYAYAYAYPPRGWVRGVRG
jgi:hypothetical protein